MQKHNFSLYVSHPQGSVLPWHEYVSGSNVHLLLVLCYCGHGHCWDDLQVHWVPRVCLMMSLIGVCVAWGDDGYVSVSVWPLRICERTAGESRSPRLSAVLYVCVSSLPITQQSREGVGRRNKRTVPQRCSVRPLTTGGWTPAHQELEVKLHPKEMLWISISISGEPRGMFG